MVGRIVMVLLLSSLSGFAQKYNYIQTEMKADSLLNNKKWKELRCLFYPLHHKGQGYPASFRRVGFAYYMEKKYGEAARQYLNALRLNSFDTLAFDGLVYSLSQTGNLSYALTQLHRLPSGYSRRKQYKRFKPVEQIEVETSLKFPKDLDRSNATYVHAGMRSRINYRWYFKWTYSNFSQPLIIPVGESNPGFFEIDMVQKQVYVKPEYYIGPFTRAYMAVGFINTIFHGFSTRGLSYTGGVQHNFSRIHAKAELGRTKIQDSLIWQPGLQLTALPTGNNQVFFSWRINRITLPASGYWIHFVSVGGRLSKRIWYEAFVIPVKWKYLTDREGMYLFNTFDDPLNRAGLVITTSLSNKANLEFSASREKFRNLITTESYNQTSFTINLKLNL